MAGVSGWKTRLVAAADVPTPEAGKVHLFWDIADDLPKYKDSTGTVNTFPSVATFNGRSGAVVPILADYDSFFLTEAEGDTLYQPLGIPGQAGFGYNVLEYGIDPANTGAVNLAAWDALMTTIGAATRFATVFFPGNILSYDFSDTLNLPANNRLSVRGGAGAQGTIIRTTHATADIFSCNDWYQEFHDLTFQSSVTRTAGAAIKSGNNVSISVYNCRFHEMFDGIDYSGGIQSGNLATVFDCSFTETKRFSIRIDGTNCNMIIDGCVGDGTAGLCDAHVEINACGSLLMANCDWIRAVNNLRFNPDSGIKGVFSVYCSNCFFDTATGSSVKFQGGAAGTNVQRVKFTNCWFSGSVTGCEFAAVTSTLKPTGIDFVNCDIFSNSAFGVLATEVQDFGLSNCRIAANSTAGLRVNAAASSVTKFTLQNNTIGPSSGLGANGIGIDIVAGTYGGYVIAGNIVGGNSSENNILDAGSVAVTSQKQIANNIGHLLQGQLGLNNSAGAAVVNARGAVTVGVAETFLFGARIPANSVAVGQTFRFSCYGQTTGTTGTLIFRLRAGPVGTVAAAEAVLVLTTTTAAQTPTLAKQKFEGLATIVALGPTATVAGMGWVTAQTATLGMAAVAEVIGSVPTTAAWYLYVTCAMAVAGTFTVNHGAIEAM